MRLLLVLLPFALAAGPAVKGNKLVDDQGPALALKTQAIPGGTKIVTVTTTAGETILVMSLAPFQPGAAMLSADFQGLGVQLGVQVASAEPADQLVEWWSAGVLTRDGASADALRAWAGARGVHLVDTAAQREKLAAYVQSNPPPSYAPPSTAGGGTSAAPQGGASSGGASGSAAPSAPTTTSVSLHIACAQRVRLFFGSSPTSGGTYGWESPNSTRSTSVRPGSVVCIADDRDRVQTCWTASGDRASLEVECGGFRTR